MDRLIVGKQNNGVFDLFLGFYVLIFHVYCMFMQSFVLTLLFGCISSMING